MSMLDTTLNAMFAIAGRKVKMNIVGVIGLVEHMQCPAVLLREDERLHQPVYIICVASRESDKLVRKKNRVLKEVLAE